MTIADLFRVAGRKLARLVSADLAVPLQRGQTASLTAASIAARAFALQCRALASVDSLADVEFKVTSQFGEDGIIEWLVSRLPGIPRTFIEFGVEDYEEANTRFLLTNRNWRGLIMDGSAANMQAVANSPLYWRHDLTARAAFITTENIEALIAQADFGPEIGLLSIDIDGNDYWVWQAIQSTAPWIVAVEYNAVLGDLAPIAVPYRADFQRMNAHASGLYAGASIAAMLHLARQKGYALLGSNSAGNNAFFVRNDLAKAFDGVIVDRRARPSKFRESRDESGAFTFLSGASRREILTDLEFVDVGTGAQHALHHFGPLESEYWATN